ncbi:MAG: replication restart helicase PriA [Candidatus Aminicenantales bacterium]
MFVRVVFPLPLDQSFVYGVPGPLQEKVRPGCRVLAPFGKKNQSGFIISAGANLPAPGIRVKEIVEVLDEEPLWDERFLSFTGALSAEFRSSWGELLQASLPPSLAQKSKVTVLLTDSGRAALGEKKLGPKERALASFLENQPAGRSLLFLRRKSGLENTVPLISRMERKGLLSVRTTPVRPPRAAKETRTDGPSQLRLDFDGSQEPAGLLTPVERAIDAARFGAFYLHGSRPALEAAYRDLLGRAAASSGKALVLVPEVALTREFVSGFETQTGRTAAVFHGRMTEKQKESAWRGLASGRTALAAGTRSSLFLDIKPLRLIIVDDEHEESYVQSESPAYDARRGAWLRARSENAVVVFGSPRPSVEGFYQAGREGSLIDVGGQAEGVRLAWIDHRTETPVLSRDLERRVRDSLKRDEPVILFLNRRGYAASLICGACGHIPRCRRCDIPLVYHKNEEELVCHYCNASLGARAGCPACGGRLTLRRGAGTQALEEELKKLLPCVPIGRFDSDTAAGREEREKIIHRFSKGRIPVLVGTQLLAYQPGVPRVRLVGILAPETLLAFSDYRGSHRTFQAVSRMTEFCESAAGSEVVVQTPAPVHFSIRAAASRDYRSFYDREIEFRRVMNYPPFAALAELTLEGRDVRTLAGKSRDLRSILRTFELALEVLGPALASVVRVRDVSRVQLVLKAPRRETIDRALDESLPRIRLKKSVVFSYSPLG